MGQALEQKKEEKKRNLLEAALHPLFSEGHFKDQHQRDCQSGESGKGYVLSLLQR